MYIFYLYHNLSFYSFCSSYLTSCCSTDPGPYTPVHTLFYPAPKCNPCSFCPCLQALCFTTVLILFPYSDLFPNPLIKNILPPLLKDALPLFCSYLTFLSDNSLLSTPVLSLPVPTPAHALAYISCIPLHSYMNQ